MASIDNVMFRKPGSLVNYLQIPLHNIVSAANIPAILRQDFIDM